MKKIILRYSIYSSIAEFVCFVLTWLIIDITHVEHKTQGAIGYVTIIVPMLFVYFGIRYYRDKIKNGNIKFLEALKVGLLIVIMPTISFAIIETVYVLYIEPDFYDKIFAFDIEEYRKILSPEKFAIKLKEMQEQLRSIKNPLTNFCEMILTIGALGVIVTLISSLLLMRKAKQAA